MALTIVFFLGGCDLTTDTSTETQGSATAQSESDSTIQIPKKKANKKKNKKEKTKSKKQVKKKRNKVVSDGIPTYIEINASKTITSIFSEEDYPGLTGFAIDGEAVDFYLADLVGDMKPGCYSTIVNLSPGEHQVQVMSDMSGEDVLSTTFEISYDKLSEEGAYPMVYLNLKLRKFAKEVEVSWDYTTYGNEIGDYIEDYFNMIG